MLFQTKTARQKFGFYILFKGIFVYDKSANSLENVNEHDRLQNLLINRRSSGRLG